MSFHADFLPVSHAIPDSFSEKHNHINTLPAALIAKDRFYPSAYTSYIDTDKVLKVSADHLNLKKYSEAADNISKNGNLKNAFHLFIYSLSAFLGGNGDKIISENFDLRLKFPALKEYLVWLSAQAHMVRNDFTKAMTFLSILEKTFFNKDVPFMKLKILKAENKKDDYIKTAVDLFKNYKGNKRDLSQIYFQTGVFYLKDGKKNQALKMFLLVWAHNPGTESSVEASKKIKSITGKAPLASADCSVKIKRAEILNSRRLFKKVLLTLTSSAGCSRYEKCQFNWYKGRALFYTKKKNESVSYLRNASTQCAGKSFYSELHVKSMYLAAKALQAGGKQALAATFFRRVYNEYPRHSYADDALLREAQIRRKQGNTALATKLEKTLQKRFPAGDRSTDAVFNSALKLIIGKDYSKAVKLLESARNSMSLKASLLEKGRIMYWTAYASEKAGDAKNADALYRQTVVLSPVSWYAHAALKSLNRLKKGDGDLLLAKLLKTSTPTQYPWVSLKSELFKRPSFFAFVELSRFGLIDQGMELLKKDGLNLYGHKTDSGKDFLRAIAWISWRNRRFSIPFRITGKILRDHSKSWPSGNSVTLWKMAHPLLHLDIIKKWSSSRNIDWVVLSGLIREESAFNRYVRSSAGARGLTQIMPATGKYIAKKLKIKYTSSDILEDPETSCNMTTWYLEYLKKLFKNNMYHVIAAYNAGEGKMKKFLKKQTVTDQEMLVELIDYEETRNYVKHVLSSAFAYNLLYGNGKLLNFY